MNNILTILGLLTLAYLASSLLSSSKRHGYGLVSGAEFIALGLLFGPAVLDFLSAELVQHAAPAEVLGVGWIGFLFGLRFDPAKLRGTSVSGLLAGFIEPLVAFAILFGLLLLLEPLTGLDYRLSTLGALAALGSATTKSGIAWAKGKYGAAGAQTELIQTVSRYNDLPGVLILAVYFAVRAPPLFGPGAKNIWLLVAVTFALGLLLAVLMALLLGRGELREDLAWVAVLGFAALGTGLSVRLGISPLVVTTLMGVGLGVFSRHAATIGVMTADTERPIIQVLLVLIGAQLQLEPMAILIGLGVALARVVAKLGAGASLWALRFPAAKESPWLGAGLLHSGGVTGVMALSFVLSLGGTEAQVLLWSFVLFSLAGDLMGSRTLKSLLAYHGNIALEQPPAEPSLEVSR